MPCLLSAGAMSRSIFWRASFVSADARLKKTEQTFSRPRPAPLQRFDDSGECRRRGIVRDRVRLLKIEPHRFREGRHEILVADLGEGRRFERRVPVSQKNQIATHSQSSVAQTAASPRDAARIDLNRGRSAGFQ